MATRPQPRFPEPDSQPYWEATKEHQLTYQRCSDCQAVIFPGRAVCWTCGSPNLERRVSAGQGTVYTWSCVRSNPFPPFKELGPYAIGFVDLDEGFRMLTTVVGVADPTKDVAIGQRVQVDWEDQEGGYSVPVFRPV